MSMTTMIMPVSSSPIAARLGAVQSFNERPCSTLPITAPTVIPLMQTAPFDRYYVTMYQPYQPQTISIPSVEAPINSDCGSGSSSTSEGSPSPASEQEKLKQRLARKAELARLSRRRKKASMNQMHEQFEFLQRENQELKAELQAVRAALAQAQKCTCVEHDGDAPDMGLLKREGTPALVELSPVSSPMSIASGLPRIPSALDLSKLTSDGIPALPAVKEALSAPSLSSVQFSAKSSAFSPFKNHSSGSILARPQSLVPMSSSPKSSDSHDFKIVERKKIKKQKL